MREGPPAQLDEVPLADLGVVEVEHQLQVGAVHGRDEGEAVGRGREGHAGMVDGRVEVLEDEHDPLSLAQLGDAAERALRGQPHRSGRDRLGADGETSVVETRSVQVEPRDAEPLRDGHRLGRGREQVVGALGVGEAPAHVAGHRRIDDTFFAQGLELGDVVARPVPDLDLETELVDPAHAFGEGQVDEDHLGADGEREGASRHQTPARSVSRTVTVPPVSTASMQASAIRSAARASSPRPASGCRPGQRRRRPRAHRHTRR